MEAVSSRPLLVSSVLVNPSEIAAAQRPCRADSCERFSCWGQRSCSWKALGGGRNQGLGRMGRTRRTRRACQTRCENRDDLRVSECSTSYIPGNSSSLGESLSGETITGTGAATPCSIAGAFSSMVVMLTSVQRYALLARSSSHGAEFPALLASVQTDMHCSFLWLFQHVFAKTPRLMLSLMIILANFVALSAAGTFGLEQQQVEVCSNGLSSSKSKKTTTDTSSSQDVFISGAFAHEVSPSSGDEELFMVSMLEQAAEEHKVGNHGKPPHAVEIGPAAALVAPISVHLEADDYECFDRTELLYQEALATDQNNPLILANYAEFLFLVRRDYERAHSVFHLALRADPEDAEIICRYGKFLWLVHRDRRAAEEAYRAAMAAEPSNPFYAGCYAHFLWHSGEDPAASRLIERVSQRKIDQ
ncbi:uncharacterized protein LOC112346923 [Selaginella moellendorffii]|uniref:uncharacterized protein LOC112346923 n=1 Tax=Selaginella moellendorffii TaxID=88036 RepID=UPI000D1C6F5D|nr:uncharacterized protein LOC112346923 [Selaginella moellendorffii]|eukprot:XP_024532606.1 uncharacterized protein LOC112346923 [Selaginella moellendorffii]